MTFLSHLNRPHGYSSSYCEEEVVRAPCDSYSSEYRVAEYDSGYPMGRRHHHHNGEYVDTVTEVVSYDANPGHYGHRHHHHGGAAEYVERREETVYENGCDPYRRLC